MPGVFGVTGAIKFYPGQCRMATDGFIINKKSDIKDINCLIDINRLSDSGRILILNDEKDTPSDEKKDINQITADLLNNINSVSWNATVKLIADREKKVIHSFTDKFFLIAGKKGGNDKQNTIKKVLICITNGIDSYRRIKYNDYNGFKDITSRYKSTKSYISTLQDDTIKSDIVHIMNNVFNNFYKKTDTAKTFDYLQHMYSNTTAFVNNPEPSAPSEDPG